MDRKRVIAAFGDVRGFRKWILRANNSPENASELMDAIYRHFEAYAQANAACMKFMGDGFLLVAELKSADNAEAARALLHGLRALTDKVVATMKPVYPRPDGFRVRLAAGTVWKRMTLHYVNGRFTRWPEYIGYAVNLAQALLYVYPEIECICHESIVELVGTKKNGVAFRQLDPPNERRYGIDPQDFNGLWTFGPDQPVVEPG